MNYKKYCQCSCSEYAIKKSETGYWKICLQCGLKQEYVEYSEENREDWDINSPTYLGGKKDEN